MSGPSRRTSPDSTPAAGAPEFRSALQPLSQDVGFRLGRAHRHLRASWERAIADLGVTAPQAAALRAAVAQPGQALRGLARVLGTDPMNARRLAIDLERLNLVEVRTSVRDRRTKGVWPTELGTTLAEELSRRARARRRSLERELGTAAYRQLEELLEQLLATDALGDRTP